MAPAHVHILATGKDDEVFETAEKIGEELSAGGVEVIYDDRKKVSAGVKFKDYELLGLPFAIVVGRGLKNGVVELRERRAGTSIEVPVENAAKEMRKLLG